MPPIYKPIQKYGPLDVKGHNQTVQYLEWDSSFFGMRIAKVNKETLDACEWSKALTWCQMEKINCLYVLVDAGDLKFQHLVANDFAELVDIRVTLDLALDDDMWADDKSAPKFVVRQSKASDIEFLSRMAGSLYSRTRFLNDKQFAQNQVKKMYQIWIEKQCKSKSDLVYVAESNRKVVGYVSGSYQTRLEGWVGLVGIDPSAQRVGVGFSLLKELISEFHRIGVRKAFVATQGDNISAVRLYETLGFKVKNVQLWYHKWFKQ